MFQKISILNKYCSFWNFQSKNPEKCIMVSTTTLSSTTVFIDDNNTCFFFCLPNQHIRMISEGSCDIKDWSNDAENVALPSQK